MAKLFVSYSKKDSVAARKLIEAFKSIEQEVWVDWASIPPAVDWLEQIFRGIEESDAFIFLISPDSVATVNNVYLIDTASGEELSRIPHKGIVYNVSFSSDGSTLATASLKVIQLWDVRLLQNLRINDLIETACSRLIWNFSESEWTVMFGDQPYTKLCENLPVP